jgi:hypothetical protein
VIEPLPVAVEGAIDEAVMLRVLECAGLPLEPIWVARGKSRLDARLPAFNNAARHGGPRLVVRDLGHDAACPGQLVETLLPGKCERLCLRIAVREIESWLMADAEALGRFLGVSPGIIAKAPECLDRPKAEMVSLARRSNRAVVRRAMIPDPASGRSVGPAYESCMIEFAQRHWSPERALRDNRAPSLNRTYARLRCLAGTGNW